MMETLQLHYSRGKLTRMTLLCLAMTALMLWVALGGIDPEESGGRRGGIARMLGAEGLQIIGWTMAAACTLLAVVCVRRAFSDLIAARADRAGLTIRTVFGSHVYASEDIAALEIRRPAGQGILQVVPVKGRGKQRGLTLSSLAEDEEQIAEWIDAVHALHAGGQPV
ncbi:MAG TPA: PH domain-containing protein [Allosphingosinicella sp.]|jgi:hypothetical protein